MLCLRVISVFAGRGFCVCGGGGRSFLYFFLSFFLNFFGGSLCWVVGISLAIHFGREEMFVSVFLHVEVFIFTCVYV